MHGDKGAMTLVRAELCERLEAVQRLGARKRQARDMAAEIHSLRRLAALYGLTPVVRIAEALERAAAEGACPTALYLDRLRDAIGCERLDENASQAMLASVSVRLGA